MPVETDDVTVAIHFNSGYLYAPKIKQEIPHLLEHYLLGKLSLDGINCFGYTNLKYITIVAIIPKKNFIKEFLIYLDDIFLNLIDNEVLFKKEQSILLNELSGSLFDSSQLSYRLSMNAILNNRHPFMISTDDYKLITQKDLSSFYISKCTQNQAELYIGTDSTNQQFIDDITKVLASFTTPKPLNISHEDILIQTASSSIVRKELDNGRIYLNMTWAWPESNPDPMEKIAILFILDILTKQDSGLLWQELQNEKGIIYEMDGHTDNYPGFGFMSIEIPVLSDHVNTCMSTILDQIDNIKKENYSKKLLDVIIKNNQEDDEDRWANNSDRFVWVKGDLLDNKKVYSLEEWIELSRKINKGYLSEISKKFFTPESLHIILIGNNVQDIKI